MAAFGKFKNGFLTVNAVDLSAFVRSGSLTIEATEEDFSAMSDTAWREFTVGVPQWGGNFTLWQSFYTSEVDASLNALVGGASVTLEYRADAGVASATNPEYTGSIYVLTYTPIEGDYDTNLGTQFTFRGTGALTRATS